MLIDTVNWRELCHSGPAIRRTWVSLCCGWNELRKHWAAQTGSTLRWETRQLTWERPRYYILLILANRTPGYNCVTCLFSKYLNVTLFMQCLTLLCSYKHLYPQSFPVEKDKHVHVFLLPSSFSMKKYWVTAVLWRPFSQRVPVWLSTTLPSRRYNSCSLDTTPSKKRPRCFHMVSFISLCRHLNNKWLFSKCSSQHFLHIVSRISVLY